MRHMGNGLCVYSCPGPCQRWGGLPDPCLQRLCLFCLQEGSQQSHRVQGKRGRRWDTHPPACLHPHCLPAFSKLGLPSNFVAVDHFVKCRVLAQEPFGVTACEVDRVPRLRRRLVRLRKVRELPTAAELGGGRSRIQFFRPPVQHCCPLPPCAPSVCQCMLHSDGRGRGGSPRSSPEGVWAGKVGPCCQLQRGQVQSSG